MEFDVVTFLWPPNLSNNSFEKFAFFFKINICVDLYDAVSVSKLLILAIAELTLLFSILTITKLF